MNHFTEIEFESSTLDIYYIRHSILNGLKEFLPQINGILLDIGCGQMPYKKFIISKSKVTDYVGIDIDNHLIYDINIKPDYYWNGKKLPFSNEKFDSILLTEVLEHVPNPNITLMEAHRVLKIGGSLFFTVPFLWPLHEVPNDNFRYTPFALLRLFKDAGYSDIEIKATGGWHASMAQMLGLWVRRSYLSERKRIILSYILKPIIKFLIAKDKIPRNFSEGQMITGLYGIAHKH